MTLLAMRRLCGLGLLASAALVCGCSDRPIDIESVKQILDPNKLDVADWPAEVQRLYTQAKAAGEDVPDNVSDWVAEDFNRIGGWEYQTQRIAASELAVLQQSLEQRGRERWECFHVIDRDTELVLMFKRRMRSYLGSIPLRELVRLFTLTPSLGSEP